ncbi:D-alanyl-D-alanine carboxypeptidase family protein [Belnapia rosea]|uniref:D-alanyl-D-alanine carboxypeptidase n=1 Tax=Belnapia rosea TaxID=938405 RepID=A0A1G6U7Q9_9PROT|nr:D-alanyl-D-alanine carboxypeptidase family protein [Belnapia rosea]SDB07817.1 D-alanyl-D-alanine carboxypeptidase [Belnapia rosea]SDD37420.1 D-alanyl-D-alanine carboxypeptidase [Belnapia rosea]
MALAVTFGLNAAAPARAQIGSERYAAIVTDARSGNVLIAASPDEQRYPASLTKMMTVYMAFEALREGRISLDSPIRVSGHSASMSPSRLGLTSGMTLTVEEAILALVTKSANDAASALGEYLGGGSEDRFAQMMTMKARALGMTRTTFRNASGLPDLDQVTTARDMALLGRRLMQDYPERFSFFSTPHFVFRGRTHWNHNRLLQEYDGADGIKTGYVNDSGFNLVASAQRDGVRLVAAVFGGASGRERDRHMMALLDQGFGQMGVAVAARRSMPSFMAAAQAAPMRQTRLPGRHMLVSTQAAPLRAARAGRQAVAATAPKPREAARAARAARAAAPTAVTTARPGLLRTVGTRATLRPAPRLEQGDAAGGRPVTRPAAAPAKPKAQAARHRAR